MAGVWEECFKGKPGTFDAKRVAAVSGDKKDQAMVTWRGICRASHSGSKAEFAQRLAARLGKNNPDGKPTENFVIPPYLAAAVIHVVERAKPEELPVAENSD
jgi:hypothetical protein